MGNDEAATISKLEKASSTTQEQVAVHPYPDWAAMQAYYGPGVPLSSYFSATVAHGHAPHPYMWGPQPLVPPFGTPYTSIYQHGVYSHPSMRFVASPKSDVSAKSSRNKDKGLMKKLNGSDGLDVSIGNVNAETSVALSHSEETDVERSSESSDNNESRGKETPRKRSHENTPISGNRKARGTDSADYCLEVEVAPNLSTGVSMTPSTVVGKPVGATPVSSLTPSVEVRAPTANQLKAGVHAEQWQQDERAVKREKRKQSNRESARRSRLKKQVETEELAVKVESLSAENTTLRSEIARLKENSGKLKTENYALTEKLKNVKATSPDEVANQEAPSVVVENFLSRIEKLREEDTHEKNSSGSKLYELLDSSPRTDAMAAG